MRAFILLWAICFLPAIGQAEKWQLGGLYSDAYLTTWQQKYQPNVQWNFKNLVLGKLTTAERQQLGEVKLFLPLRGESKLRDQPLQFYAQGQNIYVPVLSVRFFDEITQAWAYLWSNNLNLELVSDYLAMLKYRNPADFPGKRFPPPMQALGIPADAWKYDKKMDDVSQEALKSALVWIMAHELGHIYYHHPGYGPGVSRLQAQQNEMEADQFANNIMRRIGVAPLGMVHYFMSIAQLELGRGDFKDAASWQHYLKTEVTHPLTAQRLKMMAEDLRHSPEDFTSEETSQKAAVQRIYYVAEQIEDIAAILENPELHRLIVAIGLATDLQSLRKHKRIQTQFKADQSCISRDIAQPFQGLYSGLYEHNLKTGEKEWLSATINFRRNGPRISARYNFGAGEGQLTGNLFKNQTLLFDWQWGNSHGRGKLELSEDGRLSGQWGYNNKISGGGTWTLCPQP